MKVKCDACRGHKRVVGLGMIEVECDKCEGYGKIEQSELDVIPPQTSIEHMHMEKMPETDFPLMDATPIVTPTAAKKAARDAREYK